MENSKARKIKSKKSNKNKMKKNRKKAEKRWACPYAYCMASGCKCTPQAQLLSYQEDIGPNAFLSKIFHCRLFAETNAASTVFLSQSANAYVYSIYQYWYAIRVWGSQPPIIVGVSKHKRDSLPTTSTTHHTHSFSLSLFLSSSLSFSIHNPKS